MAAIQNTIEKDEGRVPASTEGVVLEKFPIVASSTAELSPGTDHARRNFVLGASSLVLGASSLVISTLSLLVSSDVNRLLHRSKEEELERRKKVHQDMMFDILFGRSKSQFYVPSFDNPYAPLPPGAMTAPTADALKHVFKHVGFESQHIRELTETNPSNVDGSILLLGGPVPNKLTRAILGKGEGSTLFGAALNKRVELPVHFGNIIGEKTGPGNRPQYRIIVRGNPLQIADDGVDDFLLITSIPNVSSAYFDVFKHRLVNVAGLHGAGMRSIDLVLKDEFLPKLYQQISEAPELKGAPAWQALFRMEVDPSNRALPRRIVDFTTYRIGMDDEDFARVREYVRDFGIRIDS